MEKFKFYCEWNGDKYLELHDHHTIWEINKPFKESDYNDYVSICLWNLEKHFKDLKVYMLGRSGRHVCVDDTPVNRRRYRCLVAYAEKMEQWLIDHFNNCNDVKLEKTVMKIETLIAELQKLQKLYPGAYIYFTDVNKQEWVETYFQMFNVDEENNCIEILFNTED